MPHEQKITLGEMRSCNGSRRLLVYCGDYKCAHSVVIDASRWGDDVRCPIWSRNLRQVCGHRGADIRAVFEKARMGTEA